MQSTKAVFISVVLALLMAPVVFYSAVLEHETETTWALGESVGSELRELGDRVNDQVNRQDEATENFIGKIEEDLNRLNDFISRLSEYEITEETPG